MCGIAESVSRDFRVAAGGLPGNRPWYILERELGPVHNLKEPGGLCRRPAAVNETKFAFKLRLI